MAPASANSIRHSAIFYALFAAILVCRLTVADAYLYRTSNDVAKVRQALRQVQWLPPKQGETGKPQEFTPYEKTDEVSPLCRRIQSRIEQSDTRQLHKLSHFMERRRRVHMDDSLQMPGLALSWYCRRTRR